MRGSGHSTQSQNPVAREAYAQAVRGLREIPVEELANEFTLSEIREIDAHQRAVTDLGKLALHPLPKEISERHGANAAMLSDNTTTYDDEGEDLLVEDDIIQNIMLERRNSNMHELTALFRVRRSVVAVILANWNTIEESERPRMTG